MLQIFLDKFLMQKVEMHLVHSTTLQLLYQKVFGIQMKIEN